MIHLIILHLYLQQAAPILDKCQLDMVKSKDQCDNCYRAYKCFWEGVKFAEDEMKPNSLRFSLYDVLGFNRLRDEDEILADLTENDDDITKV